MSYYHALATIQPLAERLLTFRLLILFSSLFSSFAIENRNNMDADNLFQSFHLYAVIGIVSHVAILLQKSRSR